MSAEKSPSKANKMKIDTKNKILFTFYIIIMFSMLFVFSWFSTEGNYINRPFGNCLQNYSVDYGAFKSCGSLMSDGTAKIGLASIYIGLPFLAFVLLPVLVEIKKRGKKK